MASEKASRRIPNRFRLLFQRFVIPRLDSVSFITLHYAYFIATSLISAVIFWGSSTPSHSVRFIDSLFLTVSAMTEAGLNTINLSTLNTWQQIMLFMLIIIGSAIFVSSAVLHVRKRAFEQKLEELAERRRKHLHAPRSLTFSLSKRRASASGRRHEDAVASGAVRGRAVKDPDPEEEYHASFPAPEHVDSHEIEPQSLVSHEDGVAARNSSGHIKFGEETNLPPLQSPASMRPLQRSRSRLFNNTGVGTRGGDNHPRNAQPITYHQPGDDSAILDDESTSKSANTIDKYLQTVNGYIGRNSQFHHLSEKERRKLGGIEYDALCLLSWVVPVYFVLWQLFGAIGVGAWLQINRPSTALTNGLNPFWTGAFFAISAFNNSGMALLDANAVALQTSYYCLLTLGLLILAGNTCFPPFLRLILWTMKICIPKSSQSAKWQKWRRILTFILDHPRRVYTNLFPASHTWWLVFALFVLNGIDWIAFEVLNIGNAVTDALSPHYRVLDGLFQAFAVRSGGFYVVSIAGLNPGLLVLYVLMMYVSAYPVSVTIRSTNVYEERSLGIYSEDTPLDDDKSANEKQNSGIMTGLRRTMTMAHGRSWSRQDFVRQQLRGQLSHDVWWLALAVFLISVIETSQFHRDPVVFSVFNIIFEVVSAYGCVGISVGVPWDAYSFCGAWHTCSKLVLCAVMLRGRHRGLPVAIDRAILLPDESLAWAEEEDAHKRSPSMASGIRKRRTATGEGIV